MKRLCVLQFPNDVARARNMRGSFRHILGLGVPLDPWATTPVRQAATPPIPGARESGATPQCWTSSLQLSSLASSVRRPFLPAIVPMLANTGETPTSPFHQLPRHGASFCF